MLEDLRRYLLSSSLRCFPPQKASPCIGIRLLPLPPIPFPQDPWLQENFFKMSVPPLLMQMGVLALSEAQTPLRKYLTALPCAR